MSNTPLEKNNFAVNKNKAFWDSNKYKIIMFVVGVLSIIGLLTGTLKNLWAISLNNFNITLVIYVFISIVLLLAIFLKLRGIKQDIYIKNKVNNEELNKILDTAEEIKGDNRDEHQYFLSKVDKLLEGEVQLKCSKYFLKLKNLRNNEGVTIVVVIQHNSEVDIELNFSFPSQLGLVINSDLFPADTHSNNYLYKETLNKGVYLFTIPSIKINTESDYSLYCKTSKKIGINFKYTIDGKTEIIEKEIQVS